MGWGEPDRKSGNCYVAQINTGASSVARDVRTAHQPDADRVGRSFGPVVNRKFLQNVLDVVLDRVLADLKHLGDMAIAAALDNQPQQFDLAFRQIMRRPTASM